MARDAVKISKNLDDNSLTNRLEVNVSDGVESLLINADGSLNATINNASLVVTATDLDIRDLSATQDNVAISDGTDTLAIAADGSIAVTDNGGSLTVDGTVAATQSGTWNITTLTGITNDVNIADGGNSITVDGTVSISGTVTVSATDLDIRDLTHVSDSVKIGDGTDVLAVNTDGSLNVVIAGSSGTPVVDADSSSLAAAASANHDYTATGGAFLPAKVSVSAESIATFEVLTGPTGSLVSRAILRTSVEHPNAEFSFPVGFSIPVTNVVRVIQTNDSNKTKILNSTVTGAQL